MKDFSSDNNKRIAKNTAFLYVRMFFVLGVSLYTTRVILNVLGVEDFGVYNVVGGFVSLFFFINSTMSNSVQRYYNFERGKGGNNAEKNVYNTSLHIQLLLCLILLGILETLGLWYVNSVMILPPSRLFAANVVYQCSVFSMLITMLQIPYSAAVIAHEKMDFYAVVSITDVLIKLLIILILPYLPGDKLIVYSSSLFVTCIIIFIINFTYSKRHFNELKYDGKFHRAQFKEMLSFMSWNVFDMFAFSIKSQGGNLIINAFFGPVVNAARGISVQIMNAVQAFSVNVLSAFRPQLVESYAQNNHQRVTSMMFIMTKISYTVFLALSLPIMLEIDYILQLWIGRDIPPYTQAFTILCLLDMLVCSLNTPLTFVSQATGDIKRYNVIRSFIIISIIPFSILANKIGADPTAVFWISLIIAIVNQPVSMYLLHRVYPYCYTDYIKQVLFPCIGISLLAPIIPFIIHFVLDISIYRLITVTLADFICIVLLGFFIILTKDEQSFLLKYIRNKL